MAELASLGIEVNARGVDQASGSLDKLSGAAKRAESAVEGIGPASTKAGQMASRAANEHATALNAEAAAAKNATAAVRMHNAANANTRAIQGASGHVGNLAAQFQDIGVSAAMAMSPLQIALQQGTQISAVLGPMGAAGAVRALGGAFLSVISPVSLVVIGLVALVAAGLQTVNWSKLAASTLTAVAGVLQTIAPYAVGAAAALALLYAPAIIAGLTVVSEAILGITARLIGLAIGFAAANPAAAFVIGITATVAAANIFRDELTNIFGVDIVGAAKTGVNFIIGSFVGAFNDLKFVWSQFPNIIGAAAVGAANAAIGAIEKMINAATGMLNSLIESVNGALSKLPGGFSIGTIGNVDFGKIDNPYSDALAGAVGDRNAALQGALSNDYLGNFGTAISQGASAASAKLKELAGSLTSTEAAATKAGGAGKKAGEDTKAGFDSAKAAVDLAKQSFNDAKDTAKGFLSTFRSSLMDGKSLWQSFGDAAMNVLDKIIGKVEDQLAEAIAGVFSGAGSAGGGGGGLFGSILGGIGKIFGFASGGYTGNGAASKAAGIVHGGEYVFSAKATKRIGVGNLEGMHKAAKGYASGGYVAPVRPAANGNSKQQPIPVAVTVGWSRTADGNLKPFVEQVSQGVSQQTVAEAAPKIVSTANQQVVPTMAKYQANKRGGEWR